MSSHTFVAMGCEIEVGGGTATEHRAIEGLFRQRDHIFSRFRADSELNRVNGSAGHFVSVSRNFADTLRVALQAAEETHGLVDPTLGSAIVAAGYSRHFQLLEPDPEPPGAPKPGTWRTVLVLGSWVGFRPGVHLDLNGVAKAMAVDDALSLLGGEGYISAGGDVAARGELTVALPDGEAVLVRRGALATSGNTKRRWLRAGQPQHHLIDPRTGLPSTSPWALVTASGANCVAADIAAKAGFLLGDEGPGWLDRRGIPARFLDQVGRATPNDTWRRSMEEETVACT